MSKSKTYKPKVVFAFVEAGMGHIAPERSIAAAFEKSTGSIPESYARIFSRRAGKNRLFVLKKCCATMCECTTVCLFTAISAFRLCIC